MPCSKEKVCVCSPTLLCSALVRVLVPINHEKPQLRWDFGIQYTSILPKENCSSCPSYSHRIVIDIKFNRADAVSWMMFPRLFASFLGRNLASPASRILAGHLIDALPTQAIRQLCCPIPFHAVPPSSCAIHHLLLHVHLCLQLHVTHLNYRPYYLLL